MRFSAIVPAFNGGEAPESVEGGVSGLSAIPEDHQGGRGAWYGQVTLAVASWIVLCLLHWENDGLWFPQDAPRHLINGVFLKDYVAAGLPPPLEYARSYLIRYPIIAPTKYPPGFYLLEAATFSVFVASPWVAKSLVLGFALLAALYQVAWLRRFVDPEAGYLGAVLPILPCIVRYSHAILLNVPALALQLATLYHARCWLEGADGVTSTRVPPSPRRPSSATRERSYSCSSSVPGSPAPASGVSCSTSRAVMVAVAVLLVPILLVAWSLKTSGQARWLVRTTYLGSPWTWLWYASQMTGAFGPIVLVGAAFGAAAGALGGRWWRELTFSGGWIAITYLFHSYLFGKDIRYILPLCTPLLSLTAVAVWSPLQWLRGRLGPRAARTAAPAAIAMLLAIHLWLARSVVLPRVDGFEAIISTIQADPGPERGSILVALDDIDWTLLTCFVRLDDPGFRLRVLPASWFWKFAGVCAFVRPRDIRPDRGRSDRIAAGALRVPLACCHGRLGAREIVP